MYGKISPKIQQFFRLLLVRLDNCLAKDCPHIDDCYLVKARQKAIDAGFSGG